VGAIGRVAEWLSAGLRRGTPAGWSVALAMALVAAAAPPAVTAFGTQANGYQMAEPASLQEAVSWMEGHVAPGATILAPVREAKWIEGLSGRATLFSSAVRYSFRPEEWRRSLAADTLLRSGGALLNEFFFVRLTDDVANATVPRGMVIGANHGGEYLDLLRIAAGGTSILGGSGAAGTLATLPNLAGEGRSVSSDGLAASVASTWSGKRQGTSVTFREVITLNTDSSTLELRASAATLTPTGFAFELHPGQVPVADLVLAGAEADLTFDVAGSSAPRLRAVLSGASATLERLPDGGIRVRSSGGPIRLLITDLSGAGPSVVGAQFLEPGQLLAAYHVGAVLLVRDPSFDGRRTRLEALGFHVAQTFGPYSVMVTP
jgi:hypothetical protein